MREQKKKEKNYSFGVFSFLFFLCISLNVINIKGK